MSTILGPRSSVAPSAWSLMPPPRSDEATMQGVEEGSALQKFASTVSLAQNTRRAVEMFKKKAQRPAPGPVGMAPIETTPSLAPVPVPPPPPSTKKQDIPSDPTLDTADVHISASGASVATDFKPGDFVRSRRRVEKREVVHKVGDKVEGLFNGVLWCPAVVAAVNGDGTCTLKWDDGDPNDTKKKSDGMIRGPNMVVTITRTFDDTLYSAMVKAKLTDVFKEADANNDGKLTYEEWESRMGKLMPADELQRLFQECDTDKNGSLDAEEFAVGLAGKYEIQWAQVSM